MQQFLQQLWNGLAIGSVYALVAVGYTLVFGVLKFINFAHGSVLTVGAYIALYSVLRNWLPFPLAFGLSMSLSGVFSYLTEMYAYRPLREKGAPKLNLLITSIGVSLLVENSIVVFVSPDFHPFPRVLPSAPITMAGMRIPPVDLLLVAVGLVLMCSLSYFVNRTLAGLTIKAVALDRDAAALMGINTSKTISLTFFLAGIMASAAGVLIGMRFSVNPYLGGFFGLKSFAAAVVGGIGSVPGAYLGGYLIGMLETFGAAYISSNYKDAIAFVLLVFVLLYKPSGLLGKGTQEKV
ncbi:MAG TPA: branched-chain amino acid ABC transporter permease [Firmicutes bacterium]|nr:branched-chain amino acid ABC transporter permease [Candidatus Fermentithermobacillaceae bacterium]